MGMISQEQAQAALGPYHAIFSEVMWDAWTIWQRDIAPRVPMYQRRTLTNVMHDLAAAKLEAALGSDPAVRIRRTQDRVTFYLPKAEILIRVKKFKPDFTVSNYPTKAARKFNNNETLPGFPSYVRLTLGYQLDRHATNVTGVYLAVQREERALWFYELPRPGAEVLPLQPQPVLPGLGGAEKQTKPARRVKPAPHLRVVKNEKKVGGEDEET